MNLEFIEGELCIINDEGDCTHVFERGDLSRAAYKHMTGWIQNNFVPELTPTEMWANADASWEAMSPERKMFLWGMTNQETQNASDICTGLLANLSAYQGLTVVKKAFQDALKKVRDQFV